MPYIFRRLRFKKTERNTHKTPLAELDFSSQFHCICINRKFIIFFLVRQIVRLILRKESALIARDSHQKADGEKGGSRFLETGLESRTN